MKIWTPDEAYSRMADACSRAEYCASELRERMRRHGVGSADADAILRRLTDARFVDDSRYARAFVRQKAAARWGRRKIAAALAAKRIDRGVAAEAMEQISPADYAAGLLALLQVKARALGPDTAATYEGRTRLFRFAASRGFEIEAITAAVRRLKEQSNT